MPWTAVLEPMRVMSGFKDPEREHPECFEMTVAAREAAATRNAS